MARPTVYDVAEAAGVSIATVSFAFTKPDRVKRETRERVLEVADRLGYVPSASARGLAAGKTRAIGLYAFDYLIESDEEPAADLGPDVRRFPLYSDEVQRGVELECRRLGYALMIGSGSRSTHLRPIIEIAGRVDGLITFANVSPDAALRRLETRIPVVELGGAREGAGRMTVDVVNRTAMAELVAHLTDVHGARRLAYVGHPHTAEMTDRLAGFEDAMRERGLPLAPPLDSSPAREPLTRESVREVIASGALPDAFVCATDQEALVVMDALVAAGMRVPHDVAVTGFDGILAARWADPPLTTVRQPMEEIGRLAVRKLVGAIESASSNWPDPLPTTLVLGASCGC